MDEDGFTAVIRSDEPVALRFLDVGEQSGDRAFPYLGTAKTNMDPRSV
jgi:hypothetical protein